MTTHTRMFRLIAAAASMVVLVGSFLSGQGLTSSGMQGFVTDTDGAPVRGASISVVHVPTARTYETSTGSNGSYSVEGLPVGGPYTVSVDSASYSEAEAKAIFLDLSRSKQVDFTLAGLGEAIELEEFEVTGEQFSPIFNRAKVGAGSSLDQGALENLPAARRSFNDLARFNPYTTINEGNRNELTVAGQNSRFNSIQIDGVRTNDQFGLNSSGQASLNNPISVDALEQISVEVSPYDVRQSGFTGASINAVTKSGTNEFHGMLYTYYNDEKFRGEDVRNGDNPDFREWTWGLNLGGPIIKDKLFFFVNYEKFSEDQVAGNQGFEPDPAAIQSVIDYAQNTLGLAPGTFGSAGSLEESDEKILAKIDWNINDDHRLSARYRKTEGMNPVLGDFDDNGQTSLSSNFYTSDVLEEDYSVQLFSRWTANFQTEIRFTDLTYDSARATLGKMPHIVIDDFPTVGETGPTGNELFLGTERFSHANTLAWDTTSLSATGTYHFDGFSITGGLDYEKTEFSNLFLESSMGNFGFDSLEDFLNDMPGRNEFGQTPFRFTAIDGQDVVARPDVAVLGYFVQGKWDASSRLTLTGGVRVDTVMQDAIAPAAQGFENAFGFANNGSADGETLIAPRVAFNYALTEDRSVQLRGGVGLFLGRSPGVFLANVFTNNGETSGQISIDTGLGEYLANDFDPSNPIISIPREDSTPVVDALEDGLNLPSIWRANLAVDYQVPWHGLILSAEVLLTEVNDGLWVENANQARVGVAPDGRPIYDGRITDEYSDVYVLRNTNKGSATNFSLSLSKPSRGEGFFGSLSYTWGESEDINPFTSSRAVSNWRNRAVLDPNAPELGTSNFEVAHRFLTVLGYEHDWGRGFRTTVSLVGEARSGRPYSVVFRSDVNGDGRDNNDLLYVPTGASDPLVSFAPDFDQAAFFGAIKETGLDAYAGKVLPRASENNPWVQVWDLKVVQDLPDIGRFGAELFFDFRNVGNWLNEDWGLVEEVGFPFNRRVVGATYDADAGVYTFESFNPDGIDIQVGNTTSRWSLQFGVKLRF